MQHCWVRGPAAQVWDGAGVVGHWCLDVPMMVVPETGWVGGGGGRGRGLMLVSIMDVA